MWSLRTKKKEKNTDHPVLVCDASPTEISELTRLFITFDVGFVPFFFPKMPCTSSREESRK